MPATQPIPTLPAEFQTPAAGQRLVLDGVNFERTPDNGYRECSVSPHFAIGFAPSELARFIAIADQQHTATMLRAFRAWLTERGMTL